MLILADQENAENEEEMEEMPTIIDVLMGYKHDSDKIIVIGKFIETILNYIERLETAGFIKRSGKGSHRNYKHPEGINITISGKLNSDAKPYQEKDVKKALERIKK